MNTEEILKKLKEIQVDAFNNVHSDDEESVLQLESETEVANEEPVGGEEVKVKRPKAEKVPEIKTLSRTTPMAGPTKFNTPEKVYTSGEKKSITVESIQAQLDDLLKNTNADRWGGELGRVLTAAEGILRESQANPKKYQNYENELEMLKLELNRKQPELKALKYIVEMFHEGM